jgi:hypothetical protein
MTTALKSCADRGAPESSTVMSPSTPPEPTVEHAIYFLVTNFMCRVEGLTDTQLMVG